MQFVGSSDEHYGNSTCGIKIVYHVLFQLNSLPNNNFYDSSKLKKFADDNFEFDENSQSYPKG